MLELMKGLESILRSCQTVRPGEQALVLADDDPSSLGMGQIALDLITDLGAETVLMIIKASESMGKEPPGPAALAMKSVNAVFRITDKASFAHSDARKEASAAGVRYYILHPIYADELKKGVDSEDIQQIAERTIGLAGRLTSANRVRLTTPGGTDVTMSLEGREGLALYPLSPVLAALPEYAEAAIAPVEGTAEGTIVVDLTMVQWKHLLRKPLRLMVQAGRIVQISGFPQEESRLRSLVALDEKAGNIAELGIGTSHIIPLPIRGERRDAARIGTAHIGIGRNDDIGGITWSKLHIDGLMDDVTVELDGVKV